MPRDGRRPPTILVAHSAGPQSAREGSGYLVDNLRNALGSGYEVRCPLLPRPDDPEYPPWRERLQDELAAADDGLALVGHSLGGSVLLKLLSEEAQERRVAGVFLVATPFWGKLGWPDAGFRLRDGFAAALPPIPRLCLYYSRDDEVVSVDHLELYGRALPQATVRLLDGHGHLFREPFPELAEDVRSALRS